MRRPRHAKQRMSVSLQNHKVDKVNLGTKNLLVHPDLVLFPPGPLDPRFLSGALVSSSLLIESGLGISESAESKFSCPELHILQEAENVSLMSEAR